MRAFRSTWGRSLSNRGRVNVESPASCRFAFVEKAFQLADRGGDFDSPAAGIGQRSAPPRPQTKRFRGPPRDRAYDDEELTISSPDRSKLRAHLLLRVTRQAIFEAIYRFPPPPPKHPFPPTHCLHCGHQCGLASRAAPRGTSSARMHRPGARADRGPLRPFSSAAPRAGGAARRTRVASALVPPARQRSGRRR